MANRYVEDRHEAKLARRVVDVRPAGTQYAEWLSEKFNLLLIVVPQLVFAAMMPSLAPILLISSIIHIVVHRVTKPQLPYRYPAGNKEKDHANKKGTGILLMGNVESGSEYERFKEIWQDDDDLRKHMLIIGTTGSGKSETLKGIFFNSLCWSSGFFVADGKADNKLPTDSFTMVRSFGRDDDLLFLNFLLGGKTPEQVRRSRRRRTNKINPVSSSDADTIIQMGANMLPKVEGEGKNWQEKALNLWRAVIQALCYQRDMNGTDLSIATIIEYLSLDKVEELYIKGHEEFLVRGEWSYGFNGIKAYLESGCPAYKKDKLLAKHGYGDQPTSAPGRPAPAGKAFEQDSMAYEQHAYRTTQLMPVLNLLDKTYGFIFRDKYAEIDMIDVTLNNRILIMLIPSLEKSAQEAENLGKLAIACLRVMMGKNLGAEIEGTRSDLITSKATAAPYPYMVALDELAYYFADGIAVMFAQARSLGFCMIAAAQDLEKLTEGARGPEAGAMLANQSAKMFMRIVDAGKTYEFMTKILGKVSVAMRQTFEQDNYGYKRSKDITIQEVDRVPFEEMQKKGGGEAVYNASGRTVRMNSFYVGKDMEEHKTEDFFVLRFLQVEPPSDEEIDANSIPIDRVNDPVAKGSRMLDLLRYKTQRTGEQPERNAMIDVLGNLSKTMNPHIHSAERGIALYEAAKRIIKGPEKFVPDGIGEGRHSSRQVEKVMTPKPEVVAQPTSTATEAPAYTRVEMDDESLDPLAFMGSPFERKPAEILLGRVDEKIIKEETMSMGGGEDAEEDPVLSILAKGKTLNLRRSAIESEFAATEEAALRTLTGLKPPAEDNDGAWVEDAVGAANQVLAVKSAEGKTVVGFSSKTSESVVKIERLLGSPAPKSAANRLEAVVSAQVTPDMGFQADVTDESLESFFDSLMPQTQKD